MRLIIQDVVQGYETAALILRCKVKDGLDIGEQFEELMNSQVGKNVQSGKWVYGEYGQQIFDDKMKAQDKLVRLMSIDENKICIKVEELDLEHDLIMVRCKHCGPFGDEFLKQVMDGNVDLGTRYTCDTFQGGEKNQNHVHIDVILKEPK